MSKDTNYGGNMLLFTTFFGPHKTFKLMHVSNDCPYMEVVYDPSVEMLVALSKTMKQNYEMLPKLDDNGEMIQVKHGVKRMNGKGFKEERRLMDVPQEFYLVDRAEQEAFIEKFALNAKDFDYKQYLDVKPAEQSEIIQNTESGQILDAKGNAMQVEK
jgi:hypothetical protein